MTPIPINPNAPISAQRDEYMRLSRLVFSDGRTGQYHMRGGICAPLSEMQGAYSRTQGYVVLCGQNVMTGEVSVWEHRAFTRVEHMVKDGALVEEGVQSFFLRSWSLYGCREFYWHENGVWTAHFARAVRNCKAIEPRARFLDLVWPQNGSAEQILHGYKSACSLSIPRSLRDAIQSRIADAERAPGKILNEPMHALVCCLLGMAQRPWRAKPVPETPVVMIGGD